MEMVSERKDDGKRREESEEEIKRRCKNEWKGLRGVWVKSASDRIIINSFPLFEFTPCYLIFEARGQVHGTVHLL